MLTNRNAVSNRYPAAKTGQRFVPVFAALSALVLAGCATNHPAQTQSIHADIPLLSVAHPAPGSTYEIRVYVIASGDTAMKIARKFGISLADFKAINPGLNPARIRIGQKVRVYEKQIGKI